MKHTSNVQGLRLRFALAFVAASLLFPVPASAEIVLTDLKGRTVTIEKPARRLLVDDGRLIIGLSFLTDDPVGLLAAWPHDVDRFGRELYETYRKTFPAIETLPRTASNTQDIQIEQVLAARPDLVVLSLFSRSSDLQIEQIVQAGIPVVFLDFIANPFENMDKSLEILGEAIGREERAADVVSFRQAHARKIGERIAAERQVEKPLVFVETHASVSEGCCNSTGAANMGKFLDFLGARNIGDVLGDKPFGQVSLEYVIASKPDIYIATGGEYMAARGGLLVGPRYDEAKTRETMARLIARPGFPQLPAIAHGNVHGISQQLFHSPLDLLGLECFAKWIHPELFADLEVEQTRRELGRFMAVPLSGNYWTD
jgi:iron complex transport system substrate-binding protein